MSSLNHRKYKPYDILLDSSERYSIMLFHVKHNFEYSFEKKIKSKDNYLLNEK